MNRLVGVRVRMSEGEGGFGKGREEINLDFTFRKLYTISQCSVSPLCVCACVQAYHDKDNVEKTERLLAKRDMNADFSIELTLDELANELGMLPDNVFVKQVSCWSLLPSLPPRPPFSPSPSACFEKLSR